MLMDNNQKERIEIRDKQIEFLHKKVKLLSDALNLINEELTSRMDDGDFCKPSLIRALNSIKNFDKGVPNV